MPYTRGGQTSDLKELLPTPHLPRVIGITTLSQQQNGNPVSGARCKITAESTTILYCAPWDTHQGTLQMILHNIIQINISLTTNQDSNINLDYERLGEEAQGRICEANPRQEPLSHGGSLSFLNGAPSEICHAAAHEQLVDRVLPSAHLWATQLVLN